jgi:hypothetical protein
MTRMSLRGRALGLLPLAALGVHQLRYRLAFGDHADHELVAEGHQYLTSLTPVLVLAAALMAAELLARLAKAWRGKTGPVRGSSSLGLAVAAAALLIFIYTGQELLEGLLAAGHPGGLLGVFGEGGWWSLPLAIVFGAAIALVLRGAEAAVAFVAYVRSAPSPRSTREPQRDAPRPLFLPPRSPFASAAPGRAPPLGIVAH